MTDILPAENVTEQELLTLALALEQKSEHPLAKAILQYGEEQQLTASAVSDFQALPGNGLTGVLNGSKLCGGNYQCVAAVAAVPDEMQQQARTLAESGKTPLFFSRDNQLLGIIAVADVLKEESPEAIRQLQHMGIQVVMLTGDNEQTAKAIGKQAGVDHVIAGVLPDGKERLSSADLPHRARSLWWATASTTPRH